MFGNLSMMEMGLILGIAVLLFGKRLPEVGRTLGKGIVEFKKGIRGLEEEFRFDEHSIRHSFNNPEVVHHTPSDSDRIESSVPKFEPPTAAPVSQPTEQV
jgi:sec-independent protein translocase protein TatA